MKTFIKILLSAIFIVIGFYVSLPGFEFPAPPSGVLYSNEPADLEDPLRRAFYTDLTREEIMDYYSQNFNRSNYKNIWLPTYRLNYPPEESSTIIRDQTHSTFLEEITHPLRESIYISGYEPDPNVQVLNLGEKDWRQKIIVKYVPSSSWVRIVVVVFSYLASLALTNLWDRNAKKMCLLVKKLFFNKKSQ